MRGLGCREHEELLPHHARSRNPAQATLCAGMRYRDATSIDHSTMWSFMRDMHFKVGFTSECEQNANAACENDANV